MLQSFQTCYRLKNVVDTLNPGLSKYLISKFSFAAFMYVGKCIHNTLCSFGKL